MAERLSLMHREDPSEGLATRHALCRSERDAENVRVRAGMVTRLRSSCFSQAFLGQSLFSQAVPIPREDWDAR